MVCEGLGKFPHEVEGELTYEEIIEYAAFLKLRNDAQEKAAKASQAKAKGSGPRPRSRRR